MDPSNESTVKVESMDSEYFKLHLFKAIDERMLWLLNGYSDIKFRIF